VERLDSRGCSQHVPAANTEDSSPRIANTASIREIILRAVVIVPVVEQLLGTRHSGTCFEESHETRDLRARRYRASPTGTSAMA
jgi:hypothetical protein